MNGPFARRMFLGRCAAGGLALGSAGIAGVTRAVDTDPTTREPIRIGDRLEPMVDNCLVDFCQGAALRMQTPQRMPRARQPLVGSYATVIKDGDLYRAFYRSVDPTYRGHASDGNPGEITCYAESRDGHEWTFPKLGLFEVAGSRANNVILARQMPFSHNFSPMLDRRPGVPPQERYKALAGSRADVVERLGLPASSAGLHAFASPDAIHWKRIAGPVLVAGRFDSQNTAFWSEVEKCYVCFLRTLQTPYGHLRTISRATSPDFVHWSEPRPLNPNLPGEHLYTSQTHPYFRAPHIAIALATRFMPTRGNSTEIVLMSARRPDRYERPFLEAFIRPGLDPQRWTNRANYAALGVVPTGPEEMSIYHTGSGDRYVLRTDGFASIHAGADGGRMLTRPVVFKGSRLVLNMSTAASGSLSCEICDLAGAVISGFAREDCVPIVGDRIEYPVSWKKGVDVSRLGGRPVRLRFILQDADLFALRFQ